MEGGDVECYVEECRVCYGGGEPGWVCAVFGVDLSGEKGECVYPFCACISLI
jgi:hypothetical protein